MLISPVGANIGVNFAIPADAAIPVIEALRAGETPQRGYLGIGIVPVSEDMAAALGLSKDRGEIVQRIEEGQAAAKAGRKDRKSGGEGRWGSVRGKMDGWRHNKK